MRICGCGDERDRPRPERGPGIREHPFPQDHPVGEEHEKAIAEKSSNWESDRIALSDMILMQMAFTEVRSSIRSR
jgi:hypothetical protein